MAAKKSGGLPESSIKSKKKGTRTASGSETKNSASSRKSSSPAARTEKKKSEVKKPLSKYQKRKRRRKQIFYGTAIGIFLIVSVTLMLVFLFRIGEIRVSGSTRYSKEQIVASSKLILGNNILTSDTKGAEQAIPKELPFIESVKVKRKSPTVVMIEVTEAVPAAVYQTPEGYILLSSKGKILATDAADYINEVPVIKGVSFTSYSVGTEVDYAGSEDFSREDIERILDELFVGIAKYNFDIRAVDWTKSITLKINYAETLIIDLGYPENIDAKLLAARCFVDGQLQEGEKGILRVSDPDNMSFTYDPNNSDLTVGIPAAEPESEPAE